MNGLYMQEKPRFAPPMARRFPQYRIVTVDEADPADITKIGKTERLVLAGRIFYERKTAEERFAALKEGREPPPREEGIPLYIKEDAKNVNPKTGLTKRTENALNALSKDLLATWAAQLRKREASEREEFL